MTHVGRLLANYVRKGDTVNLRTFASTLRRQEGWRYEQIVTAMQEADPTLTEAQYDHVVLGKKRRAA